MTEKTSLERFSSASGLRSIPKLVFLLWLLAAVAIPVWMHYDSSAWDLRIYGKAVTSLHMGHDPYVDATDIQKQHHAQVMIHGGVDTGDAPPYSYVYSPMTLPLLHAIGGWPTVPVIWLYWLVYIAGALAAMAVAISFAETRREWQALLFAAGVAPFFPGLLANGTVLSGNIAYVLYGGVFAMAWLGWRSRQWWPFYVMVLLASCVKAPLLSLALVPALSARKQWPAAIATMVTGTALFALQPVIWPALFRHYLEAVELQFSFNHDFGCSPAGLFSDLLYRHHISYSPGSYFLYAAYAVPLFLALFALSRMYLRGEIRLQQWAPVLLSGVILLNPRIMEYDVAPVTLPMLLIALRKVWQSPRARLWMPIVAVVWVLLNVASLYSWEWRKVLDGPLLTLLVLLGCVRLWRDARHSRLQSTTPAADLIAT